MGKKLSRENLYVISLGLVGAQQLQKTRPLMVVLNILTLLLSWEQKNRSSGGIWQCVLVCPPWMCGRRHLSTCSSYCKRAWRDKQKREEVAETSNVIFHFSNNWASVHLLWAGRGIVWFEPDMKSTWSQSGRVCFAILYIPGKPWSSWCRSATADTVEIGTQENPGNRPDVVSCPKSAVSCELQYLSSCWLSVREQRVPHHPSQTQQLLLGRGFFPP